MTRSFRTVALLLVSAVTLAGWAARAQSAPVESMHLISVGVGGGVSVPVSDAKDVSRPGSTGRAS